jgi:hypothetical protein
MRRAPRVAEVGLLSGDALNLSLAASLARLAVWQGPHSATVATATLGGVVLLLDPVASGRL